MPVTPFDPTRAVTFDLTSGQVHLHDKQTSWIVPSAALAQLCAAAGEEATRVFGRAVGEAMGRRLGDRLGKDASVEAFATQLAGELAIAGFGALQVERWGKALVFAIDQAETPSELTASVIEGALKAATSREVRCLRVAQEAQRSRFLVAGSAAIEQVQGWLAQGQSWGEALVKLHAPQPATDKRGEA